MRSGALTVCILLLMSGLTCFAAPTSAQILPEIVLECESDVVSYSTATRIAQVECEIENPSQYQEKVEVSASSTENQLTLSHPESITVGAGGSTTFLVMARADEGIESGEYSVNISAKVTEANGVPVGAITGEEEDVFSFVVPEIISCEATLGQYDDSVQAGEILTIPATYRCEGNTDGVNLQIRAELYNFGSNNPSWPAGFSDDSPPCDLTMNDGSGVASCQFIISTPSEMSSSWKGCIVILDDSVITSATCVQNSDDTIEVKLKSTGLGIELGGNSSILEQLGIAEEQVPIIAGGAGLILLIVIGLIVVRRRNRDDDE